MSTNQSTIDFILDQAQGAGEMRARKMFGEYAVYCDDKVVALVCGDQLFVKITAEGKEFAGDEYQEGHAYKSAKASMLVGENIIEDRDRLQELVRLTAEALPRLKPKKRKKK